LDKEAFTKDVNFLEQIEDHDDVQSVATNVNFTVEQLQALQS
jgi:transcriptional/translational regulatory protein YebC/TACO1